MINKSGRDKYVDLYSAEGEREAEWLRRSSMQKVDSVEVLLPCQPQSVMEIGCGPGAVISELRRRSIGRNHFAVDYSADAIGLLRQRDPDILVAQADITEVPDPFARGPYDVVLACHVIEHLEEPEKFLTALRRVPHRYFIAEVPLEDNPLHRIKGCIRDRMENAAGHVQFFNRRSFRALLAGAGFRIQAERLYAPKLDSDTLRFMYGNDSVVRRTHKRLTENLLPQVGGPFWTHLYHAHLAVLCTND